MDDEFSRRKVLAGAVGIASVFAGSTGREADADDIDRFESDPSDYKEAYDAFQELYGRIHKRANWGRDEGNRVNLNPIDQVSFYLDNNVLYSQENDQTVKNLYIRGFSADEAIEELLERNLRPHTPELTSYRLHRDHKLDIDLFNLTDTDLDWMENARKDLEESSEDLLDWVDISVETYRNSDGEKLASYFAEPSEKSPRVKEERPKIKKENVHGLVDSLNNQFRKGWGSFPIYVVDANLEDWGGVYLHDQDAAIVGLKNDKDNTRHRAIVHEFGHGPPKGPHQATYDGIMSYHNHWDKDRETDFGDRLTLRAESMRNGEMKAEYRENGGQIAISFEPGEVNDEKVIEDFVKNTEYYINDFLKFDTSKYEVSYDKVETKRGSQDALILETGLEREEGFASIVLPIKGFFEQPWIEPRSQPYNQGF